jgi:hypothetical protein
MPVFEVDRQVLRKIAERRGKEFALYEVVQNAWDQKVTTVNVSLTKEPNSRYVVLRVEDDDPDGFADLTQAYTLFAESAKKANPRQRGRFNIGEKLVIAICEESRIETTKGTVEFVGDERRSSRRRRDRGSVFEGRLRMTNPEFVACCVSMARLLPPEGIETYFNGQLLERRDPIAVVPKIALTTEVADDEGYLRRTTRVTEMRIYEPVSGEPGMLYEMGIPVVETGDTFHVDIDQKVPLTMDRDNVPPAFIRKVRSAVLNEVHQRLNEESANTVWVREAMEDPDTDNEAVRSVVKQRFGDKVVAYDPSDPEANNRAAANGFTVVHGRQMSRPEWDNVRSAHAIPSAGSLFPTHVGTPVPVNRLVPTAQEQKMLDGIKRLARVLIGREIEVIIFSDARDSASAKYGNREMLINKVRVGRSWFDALDERSLDLIIHELGHEYEGNHLSEGYYRALTKLGARLAVAVAKDPTLLTL